MIRTNFQRATSRSRVFPIGRAVQALALILTMAVGARGAAPVAELPPPFSSATPARIDDDAVWAQTLAQRALQAGMYHLAEGLFAQALARTDLDLPSRRALELGLASTFIAESKPGEALAVLEAVPEPRDAAWELRRAIVDFLNRDGAALAARVAAIPVDRLPLADVAWVHFLRAMVAGAAGETAERDRAFEDALAASTSATVAAWFRLAQFQASLNAGQTSEALLAQLNVRRRDFEGRDVGFEATLQYAAALDRLGRKPEAVDVLVRQRRQLPASESEMRDRTLLLTGLIGGVESADGYAAFRDLLEQGINVGWRRIALQQLGGAADAGSARAGVELPRLLQVLLTRSPADPLTEDLLYYQAAGALRERDFERAETGASLLLTRFPGSALRSSALALLASSSWQRGRYRSAADYVSRLRVETLDAAERARLAVLIGECYFRAGSDARTAEDFRNAADAYGRAQDEITLLAGDVGTLEAERMAGATLGAVFFQRVLSLISSGNMEDAAALLSGPAAESVDAESRWRAGWNYVRYLQLDRRFDEAFRQLEAWGAAENAPPDLRLKFLWLLAQLSIESDRSGETLARVAEVRAFLNGPAGAGVDARDRAEVESNLVLLAAQAQLEQGDAGAGLRAMDQLRRDFPESNAAIFSYIIQSRYLSANGQLVEAQKLLRDLADNHPNSEYAPRALYEAAEQAKKRGADAYLIEAKDLLEQLAIRYPKDNYAFFARLEQGDILRRLNQFASAEQVYLQLENNYPDHPYRNIAQLSLADTLMAQRDNDPAKFEAAISRLELLRDVSGEDDLCVEAGFKLGYGRQSHGDAEEAMRVYWDVYERFLGDPRSNRPRVALGSGGRYWLARALLELGELELKAGHRDEARRAFQAILDHEGLPGRDLAQGRLAHLQAGG